MLFSKKVNVGISKSNHVNQTFKKNKSHKVVDGYFEEMSDAKDLVLFTESNDAKQSAKLDKERLNESRVNQDSEKDFSKAQNDDLNASQDLPYPVVVYTVEELDKAQKSKAQRIWVKGELADKLDTAFKGLRSAGVTSLNVLALVMSGAALFAPFTGGVSLGAAGTVMGTVGAALTATAIAAISAIGLSLVIAVFRGYKEVRLAAGGVELVLRKDNEQDSNNDKNLKTDNVSTAL